MLKRNLWPALLLCFLLPPLSVCARHNDDDNSIFSANDMLLLDSLRNVSLMYESRGDYASAYRVGMEYKSTRSKIKKQRISALMEIHTANAYNEETEIANLKLSKQNAQIELDKLEGENEIMRLQNVQDSIRLENDQLSRTTWEKSIELKYKQNLKEEEERDRLMAQKNLRLMWLLGILALVCVAVVMCAIYIRRQVKGMRELRKEKRVADEALAKAEEANRLQDDFISGFTDDIREPFEDVVRASAEINSNDPGVTAEIRKKDMEAVSDGSRRLLALVDSLLSNSARKTLSILLPLLLLPLSVAGQNNPYGIDDNLYKYYRECDRKVQDPVVVSMCDTLIEMAKAAGEKRAVCMALDVKVGNAFFTGKIKRMRAAQENLAAYALKTEYKNHIFYGWNRIIIWYLNNLKFVHATAETKAYQEEALRLNNAYGISRGYYYMGEIFRGRGMEREAVEQYVKSVEHCDESTGEMVEVSWSYCRIGEIYLENGDYEKAESYLNKSLQVVKMRYEIVNPTLQMFRLYVNKGDVAKATVFKDKMKQIDRDGLLIGFRRYNYLSVLMQYYILTGQADKVRRYIDSLAVYDDDTRRMAYESLHDYKSALYYLRSDIARVEKSDATIDVARLSALQTDYDNRMTEIQNDKLALKNTLLMLERARLSQELGEAQRLKDSAKLSNYELMRLSEVTVDSILAADNEYEDILMKHKEEVMRGKRNLYGVVLVAMMVVLVFLLAYALQRKLMARRMEREKRKAVAACAQAEAALENKKLFIEQVSHELRTPLNSIVGFSEILSDGEMRASLSESEIDEYRNSNASGAEALKVLMDGTLELCNVESGKVKVARSKVDVNLLCRNVVERYRSKAKDGVVMDVGGEDVEKIVSDAVLLDRALSLLLDNACKFTESGSIFLTRRREGDLLVLTVTDNGCGVPPDKAEDIFKHFYKVDSFKPGIGLGLSLCRALVRLLGGSVSLDANYQNGSRFVICIAAW